MKKKKKMRKKKKMKKKKKKREEKEKKKKKKMKKKNTNKRKQSSKEEDAKTHLTERCGGRGKLEVGVSGAGRGVGGMQWRDVGDGRQRAPEVESGEMKRGSGDSRDGQVIPAQRRQRTQRRRRRRFRSGWRGHGTVHL